MATQRMENGKVRVEMTTDDGRTVHLVFHPQALAGQLAYYKEKGYTPVDEAEAFANAHVPIRLAQPKPRRAKRIGDKTRTEGKVTRKPKKTKDTTTD